MNAKKLPQQGMGFDIDVDPAALTRPAAFPGISVAAGDAEPFRQLQQHKRISLLTEGRNIPLKRRLCNMHPDLVAWRAMRPGPSAAINALSARLFRFQVCGWRRLPVGVVCLTTTRGLL